LARALDSIVHQTYPAHEIIVVDDGSTDNTSSIAKGYVSKVKYIYQKNSGVSAARNKGVEVSSGDWIAFLDCDDWYLPTRLESQVAVVNKWSFVDCVVGSFEYRNEEGELIKHSIDDNRKLLASIDSGRSGDIALLGEDKDKRLFLEAQFSDTRCFSVKRELFHKSGGFPVGYQICEDVVFIIRCIAQSSNVGVMCESTAVYFIHDAGLIRSNVERAQFETIRALKSMSCEITVMSKEVRQGWRNLVKSGYMNLFYFYLRAGLKTKAMKVLIKSFIFKPEMRDLRSFFSILVQEVEK